jgi:hypothetical protein
MALMKVDSRQTRSFVQYSEAKTTMSEIYLVASANFRSRLQFDDLTADVIHAINRLLPEAVGCRLRGLVLGNGAMAIKLARRAGEHGGP